MAETDATMGLTSSRIPSNICFGNVRPRMPEMKLATTNSSKETMKENMALVNIPGRINGNVTNRKVLI